MCCFLSPLSLERTVSALRFLEGTPLLSSSSSAAGTSDSFVDSSSESLELDEEELEEEEEEDTDLEAVLVSAGVLSTVVSFGFSSSLSESLESLLDDEEESSFLVSATFLAGASSSLLLLLLLLLLLEDSSSFFFASASAFFLASFFDSFFFATTFFSASESLLSEEDELLLLLLLLLPFFVAILGVVSTTFFSSSLEELLDESEELLDDDEAMVDYFRYVMDGWIGWICVDAIQVVMKYVKYCDGLVVGLRRMMNARYLPIFDFCSLNALIEELMALRLSGGGVVRHSFCWENLIGPSVYLRLRARCVSFLDSIGCLQVAGRSACTPIILCSLIDSFYRPKEKRNCSWSTSLEI